MPSGKDTQKSKKKEKLQQIKLCDTAETKNVLDAIMIWIKGITALLFGFWLYIHTARWQMIDRQTNIMHRTVEEGEKLMLRQEFISIRKYSLTDPNFEK